MFDLVVIHSSELEFMTVNDDHHQIKYHPHHSLSYQQITSWNDYCRGMMREIYMRWRCDRLFVLCGFSQTDWYFRVRFCTEDCVMCVEEVLWDGCDVMKSGGHLKDWKKWILKIYSEVLHIQSFSTWRFLFCCIIWCDFMWLKCHFNSSQST